MNVEKYNQYLLRRRHQYHKENDMRLLMCRKPWYQRAMEVANVWRGISKSTEVASRTTTANPSTSLWKNTSKSTEISTTTSTSSTKCSNKQKLRKCTSLKVATSFTRVCLCAPISSYNEVFRAELPPRRSNSYPRYSKPLSNTSATSSVQDQIRIPSGRHSTEGRRVFRGKSLTDDVLMRRFVVEEEAMMQVRRRNQMEVIRKRSLMRRKKLGPSPLSRMVMGDLDDEQYLY